MRDFVKAWTKVMNADRFDLQQLRGCESRSIASRLASSLAPAQRRRARPSLGPQLARRSGASVVGEQLELVLARARPAPDQRDPAEAGDRIAAARASTPVPSRIPASIAIAGTKVRPSPLSTICTSVCSEVPIIAAWARSSGRLQADSAWSLRQWPSSSSSRRFSSIAAASTDGAARRLAAREGDEQTVVEQRRVVDLAAGEGQGEQHAVELAAVQRLARRLAGLLAQVELEVGPLLAQPRQHRRQAGTGAMVGITPIRSSPCSGWPSARAMSASSSASRRTRTALSAICSPSAVKRTTRRVRSTRVTPSKVSSSRRPADRVDWVTKQASAALPKWPMLAQRDEILQLLDGGEMGDHLINSPINAPPTIMRLRAINASLRPKLSADRGRKALVSVSKRTDEGQQRVRLDRLAIHAPNGAASDAADQQAERGGR